jgi:4-aminobutyrate aminotransferase / (S)-3-amino-2-methylpropionate transaminase / 5-aminovalerate transaminase
MIGNQSRTAALLRARQDNVPRGVGNTHPIFAARAQGAQLWDIDGNEYVDFAGGIGVMNIGHSHPRVLQAVQAQLERFTHTCFQVVMYDTYVRLAERLNHLAPGAFPKKTIFLTTGAEAVENAVKIARLATGRPGIISFTSSFHGRTLLGMSLTGKATGYKQNFGPFAPEVYHAPFPYAYRGWDSERALGALDDLFHTDITPDRVAGIIIEPVLGEGGFVPAPPEFLHALRRITEDHGIVFIADEIQSGFGRTGKFFAVEHSGVAPDLITIAKSMAGGIPLAGVIGRADLMDAPAPGGLGGTFAGNPLACAAGLAVLDIFEQEKILDRAQQAGEQLQSRLRAMQADLPVIGEVRGLGPMAAIELVRDPHTREPAPEVTDRVVTLARERGVLLIKAGLHGNVVRILAPLVIDDALLDHALDTLAGVIADATK